MVTNEHDNAAGELPARGPNGRTFELAMLVLLNQADQLSNLGVTGCAANIREAHEDIKALAASHCAQSEAVGVIADVYQDDHGQMVAAIDWRGNVPAIGTEIYDAPPSQPTDKPAEITDLNPDSLGKTHTYRSYDDKPAGQAVTDAQIEAVAMAIAAAWVTWEGNPRRLWSGLGSNERRHRKAVAKAAISALAPEPATAGDALLVAAEMEDWANLHQREDDHSGPAPINPEKLKTWASRIRATPAAAVPDGMVLVPAHYACNVAYEANTLESSHSVIDKHNAPPLRTLEKLLAAAPNRRSDKEHRSEPADNPVKRWPFVESPGEFTERLLAAMREFPTVLAAVRYVLIETPPTLVGPADAQRGVPDGVWGRFASWLLDRCEGMTISEEMLQAQMADMLAASPADISQPSVAHLLLSQSSGSVSNGSPASEAVR